MDKVGNRRKKNTNKGTDFRSEYLPGLNQTFTTLNRLLLNGQHHGALST